MNNPKGAGRKKNIIERKAHLLSFSAEDWEMLRELSGSQRKIADFIIKLAKDYKAKNKQAPFF